ncbi:MAG: hypothetical protein FWG91_03520 [Lachnospiraceae bacterium]|nr:hypothetical protein [Lachnospiraceae bacterium]
MKRKLLGLLLALSFSLMASACLSEEWWDELLAEEDDVVETVGTLVPAQDFAADDGLTPTRPSGRDPGFTPAEPSFHTESPLIAMIEVNQSLSYGFDTDNGTFYLMEDFAAGKETAVFISFTEPVTYNHALLSIAVDGDVIAELLPANMVDNRTMLFQPKSMAEVNHWPDGVYTFTFSMDGHEAERVTNFYKTMPMKILAVPILANYSGRTVGVRDDWKSGGVMLGATFPIAKAETEYILGPELDLSAQKYDLNTDAGLYNVWKALADLQTRSNDYTLIVGFIHDAADYGTILGYTFGSPATVVVESEPDMLATVVHEIAHCYNIGDEYEGGHLNINLNSPPYRMQGYCINTNKRVVGMKEAVVGGEKFGLPGTGSVIYEEQRPYWVEGRTMMGQSTSYMGAGSGYDSYTMWTSSETWNHLFRTFAGFPGTEGAVRDFTAGWFDDDGDDFSFLDWLYADDDDVGGFDFWDWLFGDDDYEDEDDYYDYYDDYSYGGTYDNADYWGQCPECYGGIYDPYYYAQCWSCCYYVSVDSHNSSCANCGVSLYLDEFSIFYIECTMCDSLIWEYELYDFNSKRLVSKTTSTVKAIDITGHIDSQGNFFASPWYTYETERGNLAASRNGEYGVYFYDDKGDLLSLSLFNLNSRGQIIRREGARQGMSKIPVNVTVFFPDNAARIVFMQGEKILYERIVSNNNPTVNFTGLRDDQLLSNQTTLTWEASGAGNDELYFEIWYCPAEDEYHNIATDITGRSLEVDLSAYPGTDEGYFYIYATDGVRTGENDSPWIRVPFKAPDFITVSPIGIPESKITGEILLDLDIYDMQDGWLCDDDVVWTLDGREFMTGSVLWVWPYEVAPGTHVFTCTATNSAGLSTSRDFTFRILNDESDLPNDWSQSDIVEALTNGFVVPLNRIDGPITRGQFASIMTVLYGYVSELEDPYPDYEEGVVTDCGQDDYEQFVMVWLGVMDAPSGRFRPNRELTEAEALKIMYRVVALADPDLLDDEDDISEIAALFSELGIINDRAENTFRQNQNLTNRLALVRLNRLFAAIFE